MVVDEEGGRFISEVSMTAADTRAPPKSKIKFNGVIG